MPLILFVLGVISIVVGLAAIGTRFVDETGFDFSLAFGYQAIVGGILLIAFGKLLKHVADTDANTTRMAQAMALGGRGPVASIEPAVSEPVVTAPLALDLVNEPASAAVEAASNEPVVVETPPDTLVEASDDDDGAPVEKLDVRGYMVDVLARKSVV